VQLLAFEPLHEPPHAVPAPVHAARGATGCWLAGVGEQVPTMPSTLHAWH
jgi:hypothetical protein